jgi:hypothetical protein
MDIVGIIMRFLWLKPEDFWIGFVSKELMKRIESDWASSVQNLASWSHLKMFLLQDSEDFFPICFQIRPSAVEQKVLF